MFASLNMCPIFTPTTYGALWLSGTYLFAVLRMKRKQKEAALTIGSAQQIFSTILNLLLFKSWLSVHRCL